jgi:diguanylate cyclase
VSAHHTSLLQALRRAHVHLGLTAVTAAGLALTLLSFLTLRTYVDHNLTLVARSIAYSAEAAAVFDDAAAAQDVLTMIATQEGLLSAAVTRRNRSQLAAYVRDSGSVIDEGMAHVGSLLFPMQAGSPITYQGTPYGQVSVRGNGGVYVLFLLEAFAAVVFCTVLIAWWVSRLSREIERDIVTPLDKLASLTRKARNSRAFNLRAPPAVVKEIFNALLSEIESREAELVAKHDTLKSANASLSFLAFHDALTGLPNRARFMHEASRALRAHHGRPDKIAVLYVDSDNFKAVNDSLGHAAGDELLVEIAQRIGSLIHEGGVVARMGGDEFAVLLAPIASIEAAGVVASRIAAAIRMPIESAAFGSIESSASVGVAIFPDHGTDVEQLLAAADVAMYRAKTRQPGGHEVFELDVDGTVRAAMS